MYKICLSMISFCDARRKWDITPKWDTARQEALMQLAAYEGGVWTNGLDETYLHVYS